MSDLKTKICKFIIKNSPVGEQKEILNGDFSQLRPKNLFSRVRRTSFRNKFSFEILCGRSFNGFQRRKWFKGF